MVSKQKILIVDDDNNIAELIALYLTKECFETKIVNDGEEALREFASFRPDLIILDLMLPGVDGFEICRQIRSQKNTPIIMVSAKKDDIYMIRSMLEGLCVRWATEHITQEQLEELDEIILLSEYHMDKGHSDQLTELDGRFHQILYEASQSRILDHVLSDFHKYVQLARRASVKTEERAIKSIDEHNEILNAIKAKDAEKAGDLATIHIMHVMENLHIEEE